MRGGTTCLRLKYIFSKVAQEWLEHKKLKLRETTWEVYEGHVRNHFSDLDYLKITRINIATVEKFITGSAGPGDEHWDLAENTCDPGADFELAVRRKYLDHNPLREAERPGNQMERNEGRDKESIKILNPVQINAFFSQVKDQKYQMLFMLAIFTGARQGELLGLKWTDMNWKISKSTFSAPSTKDGFFPPRPRLQTQN